MSGYVYGGSEHDAACRDKKGTVAGVSRHQRAGEPPCSECRAAKRGYETRRKKQGRPPSSQNSTERRAYRRAYGRALLATAKAHPAEFQQRLRDALAVVYQEDA